jgi:hypothetical protein
MFHQNYVSFRHAGIFPKNIFLQENNFDEKMKHLLKYSRIFYSSKMESSKLNNYSAKPEDMATWYSTTIVGQMETQGCQLVTIFVF